MPKCKECCNSFGFMELKNGICSSCQRKKTPPCSGCGKLFDPTDLNDQCLCISCANKKINAMQAQKAERALEDEINRIILTTEASHNLDIEERIGIITAEAVIGMNVVKDLLASVRDVVGGRSGTLQKALREAREIVLDELKREAHSLGGNAVVAIDLDYGEISANGTMLMVVASGTVVTAKI